MEYDDIRVGTVRQQRKAEWCPESLYMKPFERKSDTMAATCIRLSILICQRTDERGCILGSGNIQLASLEILHELSTLHLTIPKVSNSTQHTFTYVPY